MRIAIFSEVCAPKIDGITDRLRHTLAGLHARGHEVLIFGPENADERFGGFPVVRVPGLLFPPYPDLRISPPHPRLLTALLRFRPYVVHVVNPVCIGAWGILAARALDHPVVASFHTDLDRYLDGHRLGWVRPALWPVLRGLHGLAHQNLCPSAATRRELEERGIRVDGLWTGGVDTRHFHPRRACREMRTRLSGGHPDAPLLLSVGRLSPEKNLHRLRAALDRLPGVRLALVGDGPARPALEREFAGTATHFAGFLRGEELARAYASADVFVMPSTTETFGFVVLEAMSSATPVVASDAGGVRDIADGASGVTLCDPEDPRALVLGIAGILGNEFQRVHAGELGRKRALEFSWEADTARLLDTYREAVAVPRASLWKRFAPGARHRS